MGARVIAETRAELLSALAPAGVTVYDHEPERFTPPTAIVVHGSPFIEAGDSFGAKLVRFEVWVVSALGANARMTTELDTLIDATSDALAADGWALERVAQPFSYSVNGALYLASTLYVSTTVTP
jgi:hypothetical protein